MAASRGAVVTPFQRSSGSVARHVAFDEPPRGARGSREEQAKMQRYESNAKHRMSMEPLPARSQGRRHTLLIEYIVARAWRGTTLSILPIIMVSFAFLALINRPHLTLTGMGVVTICITSVLWADLALVSTAPAPFLRPATFANLAICSIAGAVQTSTLSLLLPSVLFPDVFGAVGQLSVALVFGITAGISRSLICNIWSFEFVIDRFHDPKETSPSAYQRVRSEVFESKEFWRQYVSELWFILIVCAIVDILAAQENVKLVLLGMFGVGVVAVGMTLFSWILAMRIARVLLTRHVDFTRDNAPGEVGDIHRRLFDCLGKIEEGPESLSTSRPRVLPSEDNARQESLIRLLALDDLRRVAAFNLDERRISVFEDPSGETLRQVVACCIFELKQLEDLLPIDPSASGAASFSLRPPGRIDIDSLGRRATAAAAALNPGLSLLPGYLGAPSAPIRARMGAETPGPFGAVATELVGVPASLRGARGSAADLGPPELVSNPLRRRAVQGNTFWTRLSGALAQTQAFKLASGGRRHSAFLTTGAARALIALEIMQAFAIATPSEDQYGTARRIYDDAGVSIQRMQPKEMTTLATALTQLANNNREP